MPLIDRCRCGTVAKTPLESLTCQRCVREYGIVRSAACRRRCKLCLYEGCDSELYDNRVRGIAIIGIHKNKPYIIGSGCSITMKNTCCSRWDARRTIAEVPYKRRIRKRQRSSG